MGLSYKNIQGLIRTHKNRSDIDRAEWDQHGRWYRSEFFTTPDDVYPVGAVVGEGNVDDGGRGAVTMETNYTYAFLDSMVANVCPSSPSVTINSRRKELNEAAKFREALVNDTLRRNKAHEKIWRMATMTGLYRRSFVKAVWNDRRNMPILRVLDPRFVWFDQSAEEWEDIRYVIEVTVLTRQDFEKRVKKQRKGGFYDPEVAKKANFTQYPEWLRDNSRNEAIYTSAVRDVFEWVTIYEVYDFTSDDGAFYHFLENEESPLMEAALPFKFLRNPFAMLTFNDNLVDIGGLSDIKLISSNQERLNELDTLELWHAQVSIPSMLVNTGVVDNREDIITALKSNDIGNIVPVDVKNKLSLSAAIGQTPVPQLTPSFDKMRGRTMEAIEYTLGMSSYSRGQIGSADVATEVAVADAAARTRNGRRQKKVNDVVVWMADAIISLYEELMPPESMLPVRLLGGKKVIEVTRQNMALRDFREDTGEETFAFDIEAVPTNALENNKLVQLKNIMETWPLLASAAQAGTVDMQKLLEKLVYLLAMPDIMADDQTVPPMAGATGPESPAAGLLGQGPTDTAAGGGMEVAVEPPLPLAGAAGGPGDGRSQLGTGPTPELIPGLK